MDIQPYSVFRLLRYVIFVEWASWLVSYLSYRFENAAIKWSEMKKDKTP